MLPTLSIDATADDDLVPFASVIATKTETPIERIPQAVSIVTEEPLKQRRPQNLEQAISYVPGVVTSPWGQDSRFSQFLIRASTSAPTASTATACPRRSSASPAS